MPSLEIWVWYHIMVWYTSGYSTIYGMVYMWVWHGIMGMVSCIYLFCTLLIDNTYYFMYCVVLFELRYSMTVYYDNASHKVCGSEPPQSFQ